jgi:hypothetical protein
MSDEGFARNVRRLFGPGDDYEGLADSPLRAVTVNDAKDHVTFAFEDGTEATFRVEGDCCSHSWIEHLDVPSAVIGERLVSVEDARVSREDGADYECLQVYKTSFRTAKGDIVLEYRNSSNGYYGGYLVRERA